MNKATKIIILSGIVIATIAAIFFYGLRKQVSAPAPEPIENVKRQLPKPQIKTDAAPETLEQLPADNKQAIDSELQNIDKALQSADDSLSADVSDDELGL